MTSLTPQKTEIFYPSSDGKPLAESYVHLYAIHVTLEVLKQYLQGRQATVLADQFLYYSQGYPRLRVAPDVMVIFDVAPGGRDNFDTLLPKGEKILGSTSPLRLDPLQYLNGEVVLSSSVNFPSAPR